MKDTIAGVFKMPKTRGGKIRLGVLLAYSIATAIHPPIASLLGGAVKALMVGANVS